MLGFLFKLALLFAALVAGAGGYLYFLATSPFTVENYAERSGTLCKVAVQVIHMTPVANLELMSSRKCDCLIRETTTRFGAQRASEMFEIIRSFAVSKIKDENRRPTFAQNEMINRLAYNGDISRSCNM